MVTQKGCTPKPETRNGNFVLFGQSLGGALALRLGASVEDRTRLRAVIAESAFSDCRAIARERLSLSWLTWPLQWTLALFISNSYSPIKTIDRVAPTPFLLMHGTADQIVPVRHSLRLYKRAREPKEIWLYGRGHARAFADPAPRERLVRCLAGHLPGGRVPSSERGRVRPRTNSPRGFHGQSVRKRAL